MYAQTIKQPSNYYNVRCYTMTINVEHYKKRFERIYEDGSKPAENFTTMRRYLRRVENQGLKPASVALTYQTLQVFSQWLVKPLESLTEDDILDFLDYMNGFEFVKGGKTKKYSPMSIRLYKAQLKKFFTAIGRTDMAAILKTKNMYKLEPKNRKDLLTKAEIERLINASVHPRDKALIATLYESGARKGELLSCKVNDAVFNEYGCKLTFPTGKTGKRTVQLVYAASFLRGWTENHLCRLPNGEVDPDACLFISLLSKKNENGEPYYDRLTDNGLNLQLQKIAKRAGITKRVYPHLLRHTRATDLAEHLTDSQLKQYLGWTAGSNMTAVYVHNPETDNAVLKMNGIVIEETHADGLRVGRCPRCHELNPETSTFCSKCGLPLTQQAAEKLPAETGIITKEVFTAMLADPDVRAMLESLLSRSPQV